MNKRTKEDLATEAAQLRVIVDKLEKDDEKMRAELSKALGSPTRPTSRFSENSEHVVYSWPEIYREVGRLLAQADSVRNRNECQELKWQIEKLCIENDELKKNTCSCRR